MKSPIKICALALSFFLSNQLVFGSQQAIVYTNNFGSTLELIFGEDNTLTGSFTSAVASKDCQDAIGLARPIIGYVDRSAITFSINYPSCGSIVTLSGHISADRHNIDAISIIIHQATNLAGNIDTQFISHSTFARVRE